ncbi:MAG: chorismate mutase [Bryobacteraceae bacterium]|nr:chorismate mutase [Solibacteraceae bacterium]MCL4844231.1 chorismate mutase [Bryobacteraceae bacterium]MCO5349754.1 chorismate mutase [Bryobacteraceae bacterium]
MTPDEALRLLDQHRDAIDQIDLAILERLNARAAVVEKIGAIKKEMQFPIYEPKREDAVFRNVIGGNGGPLSEAAVRRLFERIIDEMRTLQRERMEKENQS